MKLTDLAATPQLIKIVLDDEEILAQYNEPIEFWTWDRQPIEVFLRLAEIAGKEASKVITVVKDLMLDEHGNPVIKEGQTIPGNILFKAVNKLVDALGK
jgi:hypothetical protein